MLQCLFVCIGFFKRHIKQCVSPGSNATNIIKRHIITRAYRHMYVEEDIVEEAEEDEDITDGDQYTIPNGNQELNYGIGTIPRWRCILVSTACSTIFKSIGTTNFAIVECSLVHWIPGFELENVSSKQTLSLGVKNILERRAS